MNTQREFLQLQQNHITDVTFRFATGLEKKGKFGPYFLYTVVHEGKEKLLNATETLEKKLRKLNIQPGQTLSLVKEVMRPKKGEPFTVINILESNSLATLATATLPPAPGESRPVGTEPAAFGGDKQVMFQSLVDAVEITKSIGGIDWRNNDIEKIGVSLFLSRTGQLKAEHVLANGNGNERK